MSGREQPDDHAAAPRRHTSRNVQSDLGRIDTAAVTGEAGGNWHVERREDDRTQIVQSPGRQQFLAVQIPGDEALGLHVLDMVSVMA